MTELRRRARARGDEAEGMRLFDWARLEAAQREGTVSARFSPEQILMVVESLCVGWLSTTPPFLAAADKHTPEHRNPQPLFGNEEALSPGPGGHRRHRPPTHCQIAPSKITLTWASSDPLCQ